MGIRLLNEGNYEEAILAFTAVIDIDPRNVDAWIMLADVYIRQNDFDKALEVLQEGLDKTGGAQEIADKIKEIESGNIYDTSGNQHRQNGYDENGVLIWYHIFTYDQKGNWLSVTSYDALGNQTGHLDCRYDEEGRNLTSFGYDNDGIISSYDECVYDKEGNVTERIHYLMDGTETSRTYYQYDGQGREVGWENYSDRGLESWGERHYNSTGNEEEVLYYYKDKLTYRDVNEFDEKGKMQKTTCYDGDDNVRSQTIYYYNDQGIQIGYDYYDAEGNLVTSVLE